MITAIDKKTALVLIDLQKGIVSNEMAHDKDVVLKNVSALIQCFRQANLPVVIVHVNPMGAAWTKARVEKPSFPQNAVVQTLAKVAMPVTGFDDIVPEVDTKPHDIFITKKTWNAFFDTPLHIELKSRDVTGIVLAGISTSIGVEGTARAASELGYNITIATDATTDRVLEAYNNSIKNILPRISELGTTQEIILMIEKSV